MQGGHHESWQGSCSSPSLHIFSPAVAFPSSTAPLRRRSAPFLCVSQPPLHIPCQQPTGGLPILALPRCCCAGSGNALVLFHSGGYLPDLNEGFVSLDRSDLSRSEPNVEPSGNPVSRSCSHCRLCMSLTAVWRCDLVSPSEVGANARKGTKRKPVVSSLVAARQKGLAHHMGTRRVQEVLAQYPPSPVVVRHRSERKKPPRPVGVTGSKSTLPSQDGTVADQCFRPRRRVSDPSLRNFVTRSWDGAGGNA